MKRLLILVLIANVFTLVSFSESHAQGISPEVKKWCLALNEQNKELAIKIEIKDSLIHQNEAKIQLKEETIQSFEREAKATDVIKQAFREGLTALNDAIQVYKKQIKNAILQRNIVVGVLVVVVVISLL